MSDDEEATSMDSMETMLARHRKERKELQAKIQAMKKVVSKGDKRKKKEFAEESAKMEADLDSKHQKELAELDVGDEAGKNVDQVLLSFHCSLVICADPSLSWAIFRTGFRSHG
jgi:hypothetical protein